MGIIMTTKELRPRDKNDHYPTPIELCRAALKIISETHHHFGDHSIVQYNEYRTILDPGCGTGVWGKAAREIWPNAQITGVDIVDRMENKSDYNSFSVCNFLELPSTDKYELIIGNPPYKLAQEFIEKSHDLLGTFGRLLFLLRLNFLEGQKRGKGLWKEFAPNKVHVLSRRPSYTGDGRTDATAYMTVTWNNEWLARQEVCSLHWLDWEYGK